MSKYKQLKHSQVVQITLWASKNLAALDGLTKQKAFDLFRANFPDIESNSESVAKVLIDAGAKLLVRGPVKSNGEQTNLAKFVKALYVDLGKEVPDELEALCK